MVYIAHFGKKTKKKYKKILLDNMLLCNDNAWIAQEIIREELVEEVLADLSLRCQTQLNLHILKTTM